MWPRANANGAPSQRLIEKGQVVGIGYNHFKTNTKPNHVRANSVTMGHMIWYTRPGAGAKPQPGPLRQHLNNSNSNIFKTIYLTSNTMWYVGSADFAKVWTGGEVRGSIPTDSINFKPTTNNKVPCGSPRLGHVAPYNQPKYATCHNIIHPYLSTNECHMFYGPANPALPRVVRTCHVSIRTDCSVSIPFFYLFVILNRT
jgi:hypothetical protein